MSHADRTPRNTAADTAADTAIPADPNRRPQDDPRWGHPQQQAQSFQGQSYKGKKQMGDDPDAHTPGVSHVLRDQPEPTD